MKRILALAALLGLWLAVGAAVAQPRSAPPPAPPHLTPLESAQLQNYSLRAQNLQLERRQLDDDTSKLQQDFGAFLRTVAAEHPGWTFNPNTGAFSQAPKPPVQPAPREGKK